MASSGTTTFNPSIDDVIEEAYERCGVRTNSGYDLKSARRSLNLLFSEWGNRGINLWKVKSKTETLTKISRSEYIAIPNKTQAGTPSQYYVDRQLTPTISLYLAPDTSAVTNIFYYYLARIEDVGAYTNTADMPFRFFPCMVSGLAFYLSQKIAPDRIQALKLLYEDELKRALEEDGQRTSVYISPNVYYPQG